ncbi:MAG: helix-turn-helix domain-containing protein [Elusimicrobiota bacterium]
MLRERLANYPYLLGYKELSELLGIKVKTLRNWKAAGILPWATKKIGREVKVRQDDLVTWIEDGMTLPLPPRRRGRPKKYIAINDRSRLLSA